MHLILNLKAPIPNKQVNLGSLGKVKSIFITSSIGEVFWTASVNIVGIMVKTKRQREADKVQTSTLHFGCKCICEFCVCYFALSYVRSRCVTHIWFDIRFRRTHLSKYVYKLPAELVNCILLLSEVYVGCLFADPKANCSQGKLLDSLFAGKTTGVILLPPY